MIKEKSVMEKGFLMSKELSDYDILEGIVDWIRVVDLNGEIIYANKAMMESLDRNIIGMKCYEAHNSSNKCSFCITEKSIETGDTFQKEELIDGKYYSIKSSPLKNNKGEIIAAVEVFRNVTRERKLELELINKNRKMNEDLRFAKKIQEKMLPRRGKRKGIDLNYIYKASEMLSGDMFDLFYIDDENIGIYISDVAGNGVAASIMTMFVRQTMRVMRDEFLSPSKMLEELHERFKNLNLEVEEYFTILYGIYNIKTKKFRFANAGHNCIPIKFNGENIELLEAKGYPIISILDTVSYKEECIQLEVGDKVLFYTDGVTETRNRLGEQFGLNRIIKILKSDTKNQLKDIERQVVNFSWGTQQDDFAIMLIEIKE